MNIQFCNVLNNTISNDLVDLKKFVNNSTNNAIYIVKGVVIKQVNIFIHIAVLLGSKSLGI